MYVDGYGCTYVYGLTDTHTDIYIHTYITDGSNKRSAVDALSQEETSIKRTKIDTTQSDEVLNTDDTQTHTQTDTQTDTHTHICTHVYIHTYIHIHT